MRYYVTIVYFQIVFKTVRASGYAACVADSLLSSGHAIGPATILRRGGRCVQKINGRFLSTWDAAWQECEGRGGVLPTILSAWELERLNEWARSIPEESTNQKTNPWMALKKQTDNTAGQLEQIAWMQSKVDLYPLTFNGHFNEDIVVWSSTSLDVSRKCARWFRASGSEITDKFFFGHCVLSTDLAGVYCQFFPPIMTLEQVFKRTLGYIYNATWPVVSAPVENEMDCGRECANEKFCYSFNVLNLDQPTKQCQLLGASFDSQNLHASLVSRADAAFWMFDG